MAAIRVIRWSKCTRTGDDGFDGGGERRRGTVTGHPHGSGTEYGLVNAKRIILLLVVAFVLFFLISQPQESATVVDNVLGALKTGAEAIITFFKSLFA